MGVFKSTKTINLYDDIHHNSISPYKGPKKIDKYI